MNKRLFSVAVALGVLASLAWTTPSQAGTLLVTTTFDFTAVPSTSTVTDVTVTYNTTDIFDLTVIAPPGSTLTTDGVSSVTETFPSAMSSGSVQWTFETTGPAPEVGLTTIVYSGGSGTTTGISVTSTAVPEPSSMALMGMGGIGLSTFLTLRRLLNRYRGRVRGSRAV